MKFFTCWIMVKAENSILIRRLFRSNGFGVQFELCEHEGSGEMVGHVVEIVRGRIVGKYQEIGRATAVELKDVRWVAYKASVLLMDLLSDNSVRASDYESIRGCICGAMHKIDSIIKTGVDNTPR